MNFTHPSHLSWYEHLYIRIIDTQYPPAIILLAFLWLTWLPMVIILTLAHRYHLLEPFQIQNKTVPSSEYWRATRISMLNFFFLLSPTVLLFPVDSLPPLRDPVPSPTTIFTTILSFVLITDFMSYWSHRWTHAFPSFYRVVHKTHHSFYTPFAMTVLAMHPVEYLMGGVVEAILVAWLSPHFFTILVYSVYRSMEGIYSHSGFDLPFHGYVIPLFGGSMHHDLHHSENRGNFGEVFTMWDTLFGTRVYPKTKRSWWFC